MFLLEQTLIPSQETNYFRTIRNQSFDDIMATWELSSIETDTNPYLPLRLLNLISRLPEGDQARLVFMQEWVTVLDFEVKFGGLALERLTVYYPGVGVEDNCWDIGVLLGKFVAERIEILG